MILTTEFYLIQSGLCEIILFFFEEIFRMIGGEAASSGG